MGSEGDDDEPSSGDSTNTVEGRPRRAGKTKHTPIPDARYSDEKLLGKGGMGEVVSVHDSVLGREVAIKRMRAETPTPIQVTRFLREAQIQSRLDHPAIPPVHELAHDERGLPYFVMKRLKGVTLLEILEGQSRGDADLIARYPRKRLLRAFTDVCLALELAHTRGIIHRDIKPANIMLGEFGEVFVLDWGIAKIAGDLEPWAAGSEDTPTGSDETAPGTIKGTRGYMAPEQRHGDEVDAKADIYALGCVLFEILTIKRVPRDLALAGALHPTELDPDISPELDKLCAAATVPIPAARLATARALAEGTQRYLDGDRDLELRKQLAHDHYRRALKAAEDREHDDDAQRTAIREAGRALALDPTHADAAGLVTRLMIEPARRMPPELAAELEATKHEALKGQARLGLAACAALAFFIPHMLWAGVRKPFFLYALIALIALLGGHAALGTRVIRFPKLATVTTLLFVTAVVALMSRMYSPFIIAPGIATLIGVILMNTPLFRNGWLLVAAVVMLALAAVGPYLLEVMGVLSPTMVIADDRITITQVGVMLRPFQVGFGLTGFVIGLITVATTASWIVAKRDSDARRQLQIQAWQLRQLVPAPQRS